MTKRKHKHQEISNNNFLTGVTKGCTAFLWLVILGITAVCGIIFLLAELGVFGQ